MIDIKVSMFFDKPHVMKRVKDGTKSVLAKAGAFVRTRARRSIRKRKKSSTAGVPPSSHVGLLRDRIFFGYDASTDSVVIGPTLFKRASPTVPQLLEAGGVSTVKGKPAIYHAFPFMRPALEAESHNFPQLFTDCVTE